MDKGGGDDVGNHVGAVHLDILLDDNKHIEGNQETTEADTAKPEFTFFMPRNID